MLTDSELQKYKSEDNLILDLMPFDYIPTDQEKLYLAVELVRAMNRYREMRYGDALSLAAENVEINKNLLLEIKRGITKAIAHEDGLDGAEGTYLLEQIGKSEKMDYQPGERADCKLCGKEIIWNGSKWQHVNYFDTHTAIPIEKPKTVKVKIAVVIDDGGNWSAAGWGNGPGQTLFTGNEDAIMEAASMEISGEHCYWLTAELELLEVKEIEVSEIERVTE